MRGTVEALRGILITAGLVVRQAVVSFRYNWGIALLATALAISIWVYVTDRENPERTGQVAGSVAIDVVNAPLDQAVLSLSEDTVTVRVRAPQSVFERLTAEDFRATIDLSAVVGQRATVPVEVRSEESRAAVISFSPAVITVTLEDIISRTVPVRARLVGTPPRGFAVGETTLQPEEAVVTGPESLVDLVDAVEADVDLSNQRTSFEDTLLLQPRGGGGSIEGVRAEPESASVRVQISQLEFSSVFVVQPDVRGLPAAGFRVAEIRVEPVFVTLSGPTEVFAGLDPVEGISTEPVPIDGATSDVVAVKLLLLPEGARVDQPGVTVRIVIEPVIGTSSESGAAPSPPATPRSP